MAKVGLKYPVYGELKDGAHEAGKVIAEAIKANITAESNDVKLYGDDRVVESDKSFKSGKISLNVTDLPLEIYASLLGHTYTEADKTVVNSGDDIAPFVGIGFYGKVQRNSKVKYVAKFVPKVQFSEPNDETETKGDTVTYQTPTIEGDIFTMENGKWKEEKECDTEEEARTWLNGKVGITATP